ncbi:hypothetical protein H257_18423 [Aphanomyces astaci]|uniref:Uncharacterized protein n=1 Tax=Aphanomyces astaci TaxID=112090 RepID=W4FB84_APHAT|nr:hypothetical protein H257_18423 [Aphanomyces astaci]ETV64732.1 hypothetical protein H257_18423 [Aphanomyces astaci]|eukprot:XP_009845772.1 hypothetical protein H257_18423 [Aphanomyces astaci]
MAPKTQHRTFNADRTSMPTVWPLRSSSVVVATATKPIHPSTRIIRARPTTRQRRCGHTSHRDIHLRSHVILGAAFIIALDRRFRGIVAAEDMASKISLVSIAFVCAMTSVAVSTFNGDATPLQDPTVLRGYVWAVMVKDLVLRLASLGTKALVGLVLVNDTASTHRRQQRMYAVIEAVAHLVRSYAASFSWWTSFYEYNYPYFNIECDVESTVHVLVTNRLEFGSHVSPSDVGNAECCICCAVARVTGVQPHEMPRMRGPEVSSRTVVSDL